VVVVLAVRTGAELVVSVEEAVELAPELPEVKVGVLMAMVFTVAVAVVLMVAMVEVVMVDLEVAVNLVVTGQLDVLLQAQDSGEQMEEVQAAMVVIMLILPLVAAVAVAAAEISTVLLIYLEYF
jgi:hypothetical protein